MKVGGTVEREKLRYLIESAEMIAADIAVQKAEYYKVNEAITFCRDWLEEFAVDEALIYELLDDEDEDDLVGYYLGAETELVKLKLGIILGVFSCVAVAVLYENKSPIPQYLGGIDKEYYEAVLMDVQKYRGLDDMY